MFIASIGRNILPPLGGAMSIRSFKGTIKLPPFQRAHGPPTEGGASDQTYYKHAPPKEGRAPFLTLVRDTRS